MNRKNAVINVRGVQIIDGERDSTEIDVVGALAESGGGYTLSYTEYDDENKGTETVVRAENNSVSVTKIGEYTAEMIFEEGKRYTCNYTTPFGSINMGVFSEKVNAAFTPDGGKIELIYNIDFNTGFVSRNEMTITFNF